MTNQYVKDCLVAIANVRRKFYAACDAGDVLEANEQMGKLTNLYVCLVIESQKLVVEMDYVLEYQRRLKEAA